MLRFYGIDIKLVNEKSNAVEPGERPYIDSLILRNFEVTSVLKIKSKALLNSGDLSKCWIKVSVSHARTVALGVRAWTSADADS